MAADPYLTPPAVARRLGVGAEKVARWIRSGELLAVNLATSRAGRPRWAIAPEALQTFLACRQAQPPTPRLRRRRPAVGNVIEFF